MKVGIATIVALVQNGALNTTEHDVPVADAYKASKFRRELKKAFDEIVEREKSLAETAGLDLNEMDKASEEAKTKFAELRAEMFKDEMEMAVKPMPYGSFHALAKENRQVPVQIPGADGKQAAVYTDPFRACEDLLEGILWVAPEDND